MTLSSKRPIHDCTQSTRYGVGPSADQKFLFSFLFQHVGILVKSFPHLVTWINATDIPTHRDFPRHVQNHCLACKREIMPTSLERGKWSQAQTKPCTKNCCESHHIAHFSFTYKPLCLPVLINSFLLSSWRHYDITEFVIWFLSLADMAASWLFVMSFALLFFGQSFLTEGKIASLAKS